MYTAYERLLQNLNVVKNELKSRNDPALNLCIKYIKDAIFEAGRLNRELVILEGMLEYQRIANDIDDWSED
jgi:hypothetical protein